MCKARLPFCSLKSLKRLTIASKLTIFGNVFNPNGQIFDWLSRWNQSLDFWRAYSLNHGRTRAEQRCHFAIWSWQKIGALLSNRPCLKTSSDFYLSPRAVIFTRIVFPSFQESWQRFSLRSDCSSVAISLPKVVQKTKQTNKESPMDDGWILNGNYGRIFLFDAIENIEAEN